VTEAASAITIPDPPLWRGQADFGLQPWAAHTGMICVPLRALDHACALPQPTVTSSGPVTWACLKSCLAAWNDGIV